MKPEGKIVIRKTGHRQYVGGMWEKIGRLQFAFLVQQGLKPSHCLLDIGCGSLRGGIHFIRYLETGNYLGMDKEKLLIELGIDKELGMDMFEKKQPQFVISNSFMFGKFSKKPQFAIAQSLFTHLTSDDIRLCLTNLRRFISPPHVFYASFFKGNSNGNQDVSNSRIGFYYPVEWMSRFGEESGWKPFYIGRWNHPRGQVMIKYEAQ